MIRAVFLGTYHPHAYHRLELLQARNDVQLIGYWEEDDVVAAKIAERFTLPRFLTAADLLANDYDVAFIHSLDHDVPRLTLLAVESGAAGVFLEKPGASRPEQIFKLADDLTKRKVVVEVGWEMHYSEVMEYVRNIVHNRALGEITTSRFHGGCPSGAGAELWQRLPDNLGGLVYEEGGHTIENIVDLFGLPRSISASVRKLHKGKEQNIVSCFYDMHKGRLDPETTKMAVGDLVHEDIGSVILEYDQHNVIADFTAWEPTYWCEDWGIDIYGTNGVFHGIVNPPKGELLLRTARGGFSEGVTKMPTAKPEGERNEKCYYSRQVDLFFKRCTEGAKTEMCDMKEEVKIMKVLEGIYRSASERRFVDIAE